MVSETVRKYIKAIRKCNPDFKPKHNNMGKVFYQIVEELETSGDIPTMNINIKSFTAIDNDNAFRMKEIENLDGFIRWIDGGKDNNE